MPWFAKDWREMPFGSAGHLCLSEPCPRNAHRRSKALASASLPFRQHVVSALSHGHAHPNQLVPPWPTAPTCPGPASVQALTSPLDLFCPKASDCSHFHLAHLQPILNFVIYSMNNYSVNYSAQMRRPRYFINVSSRIKFFMRMFHAYSEQYCILHSKMGESVDLMLSVLTTIIKTEPFTHESWVKY